MVVKRRDGCRQLCSHDDDDDDDVIVNDDDQYYNTALIALITDQCES